MNFQDWAPLRFVDPELLSQVRLAYVFGVGGQEAFFITENDEVFACGANYAGCLGLEEEGTQIEPVRVPELCQKNVKGFSYSLREDGGIFMCAYTSDRTLYHWGHYLNKTKFHKTPNLFQMNEFGTKVLEVVAGSNHCLILTIEGQIFSFGYDHCGQLGRSSQTVEDEGRPGVIKGDLKRKKITKVSCGTSFSVAILDKGEVYAWGNNSDGQLGVGNEYKKLQFPKKISTLKNAMMKNIVCGEYYVLAISDIGELYSWGQNDVGQLGLGDTTSRFKPVKVEKIGRVIDVTATPYDSTSAAMTENNEVYMWGACGGLNLVEPTKTRFNSLFDVFAFNADPRIMPRPILRELQPSSIIECIRNAFNDPETSDLTIVAEEKEIFVHKVILMLRSDYFKVLLRKPWLEEDKKVLKINQCYDSLRAYLQYLYSNNFVGSPEIALDSLRLAHEYHDLTWKKICENHVKNCIAVENVATLYNMALKLDTKVLAKQCVLFAGKYLGSMIETPGFSEWDVDTHKQFLRDCHKEKVFQH